MYHEPNRNCAIVQLCPYRIPMSDRRTIPSLDGLRALAVLSVVAGHSQSPILDSPWFAVVRNGDLGVIFFFVISGFLISHLLLSELKTTGHIQLGRFYARRSFRIFPPFYVYLAAVAGLGLLQLVPVDLKSLFASATYTWNYYPSAQGWALGHTWSLSLEEQFYLLWPLCLACFPLRTCLAATITVILISPASRVLTYFLLPELRGHINMMLHTHVDAILFGAFLALSRNLAAFPRLLQVAQSSRAVALAGIYLVIQPALSAWGRGKYALPLGMTLDAAACSIILLYAMDRPARPLGRLLNSRVLTHTGRISYSIYLWQQLFTGPYTGNFPLNVVWIFLCAEASYWLVELPSFRIRDRLLTSNSAPSTPVQ